ncbi:VIRB2 type IV secretion [Neorhizobium sp. P12A]|jgi:type IV secretion system protein VirB2|uniref:TrbC/VirB2 family protein n=1 Tax=Rhizobium/Agrobacterium group TaxID=227290 RepID=UPI001046D769|nr:MULTISPECIES: TrbC/VirB2 family protein [Rhizobium/Agrobacterium group]KAA0693752.1 VIRB2 type IV secretion [Neorhizobium sp. P12A]TCR80808.1 type IV secretion system protein VirB2 [Rhizobium sp. BK376]
MKPAFPPRPGFCLRATLVVSVIVLSQIPTADLALAQATNQAFAPLQTVVQAVVDFITGPFGRLVAIIAVIGLGFLAFAGRLSWFTAGAVVLGIGLVFGAPAIVDQLISTVGN